MNFREMTIEMAVALCGGFTVTGIETEAAALTTDVDNSASCGVSATNCGDVPLCLPGLLTRHRTSLLVLVEVLDRRSVVR